MNDVERNILQNLSSPWRDLLVKKKNDRLALQLALSKSQNCTPPPELWFEWARLTPLDNIKIVIIGQDPYPTKGTAHGLAFSSLNGPCPDSLRNVFKCLEKHNLINDHKQTTSCLTTWAQQGVLLLNTALSTEIGQRRAHFDIWQDYVRRILVRILQYHIESGLIIMCWGRDAQNLVEKITANVRHKFNILNWCHPSPLTGNKFLACNHFIYANEILAKCGKTPINWATIVLQGNNANGLGTHTREQQGNNANGLGTQMQSIFTDGSAVSKGNRGSGGNKKDVHCRGGYAAVFIGPITGQLTGSLDTSKIYASNIRAEGQAIISALDKCQAELNTPTQINLYTDSEFWIKMVLEYMPKWSHDKFLKKENSDMTLRLWPLWKELNTKHKCTLIHVYSHNKSGLKDSTKPEDQFRYKNNELADKLAETARKTLNKGQEQWK